MGDRLATIDISRKVEGLLCSFRGRGAGSTSKTMSSWAEVYRRTKRHLDPSSRLATIDMDLATIDMDPIGSRIIRTQVKSTPVNCESRGCCAPFRGGGGSPSNTMWPRPSSTPSGILIRLATKHQHHILTDKTEQTCSTTIR